MPFTTLGDYKRYIDVRKAHPKDPEETEENWRVRVGMPSETSEEELAQARFKHRINQNKINDSLYLRNMQLSGAVAADGANLDKIVGKTYTTEDEAYHRLIDQFDASTPKDGCIFWNGIQETKLVVLVDEWNRYDQSFGQLEATTKVRIVNKKFKWEGITPKYFTEVSGMLGHSAKGHITAVATSGLRNDSILTTTELPAMLALMENALKIKQAPPITDMSFVVIEPKNSAEPARIYTNNEISRIAIIRKSAGAPYISGRSSCDMTGAFITVPWRVRDYWAKKLPTASAAANNILANLNKLK